MGPKSSDKCPCKRHMGDLTGRSRRGSVTAEAEAGVTAMSQSADSPQELEEAQKRFSPTALRKGGLATLSTVAR